MSAWDNSQALAILSNKMPTTKGKASSLPLLTSILYAYHKPVSKIPCLFHQVKQGSP